MNLLLLVLTLFSLPYQNLTFDLSVLEEKSIYVQLDNSEELTKIVGEKSFFIAGESFPGYNSKLSIKGTETALKVKKGTKMVFYARGSSTYSGHGFPISIVKMEVTKNKRIASSKEGLTPDKNKTITAMVLKATEIDKAKKIYRITMNNLPETGVWCVNFHRVSKGKFMLGGGYGKQGFCFEITE